MTAPPRSALIDLARAMIVVSTQSIGGGPSTLFLMRRQMVERYRWLTHRQFLEDYALAKMSLGINLIALAGLVGSRVAGLRGSAVAVIGLILPAAAITLVLTAAYVLVRDEPLLRAALSGAGPAAAGMTAGLAFSFARQAVRRGWHGALDHGYGVVVIGAGLLLGMTPQVAIAVGIVVGVTLLRGEPSRASGDPGS